MTDELLTEDPSIYFNREPYPTGWKLMQIKATRPRGIRSWLHFAWGADLWLGPVPAIRVMVIFDAVLVWALR